MFPTGRNYICDFSSLGYIAESVFLNNLLFTIFWEISVLFSEVALQFNNISLNFENITLYNVMRMMQLDYFPLLNSSIYPTLLFQIHVFFSLTAVTHAHTLIYYIHTYSEMHTYKLLSGVVLCVYMTWLFGIWWPAGVPFPERDDFSPLSIPSLPVVLCVGVKPHGLSLLTLVFLLLLSLFSLSSDSCVDETLWL